MGAPNKRAKKIRKATDFDIIRLAAELRSPRQSNGAYSWTLEEIRNARDAQLAGTFSLPFRLAAALRTDDAFFVAYQNRLAPLRGLPVKLVPPSDTARAMRIADEAEGLFGPKGVGIRPETVANINGDLANHGIAVGVNVITPREDGSRVDFEHHYWPLESIRWDGNARCLLARIEQGSGSLGDNYVYGRGTEVPVVHGDGRWVVYTKQEHEPWRHEAAILAAALLWATHAHAWRDWSKGSTAHGNVKMIGKLPEMALQEADGSLSPEADAMIALLKDLVTVDSAVGIVPSGGSVEMLSNPSSAWQIFKELAMTAGNSASRIYLGTDGVIGTNPTGPGVDMRTLFGVRNDLVEGDLRAIERGILTGIIEPWCAVNFGDSTLAPARVYLMPDADQSALRDEIAKRTGAFLENVRAAKEIGFDVDQVYIDALADDYGVRAPRLKVAPAPAPLALAPQPPLSAKR